MKRCPYCGSANDDLMEVCRHCKAQVLKDHKILSKVTNLDSADKEETNKNGEETLRVNRKKIKE